MRGLAALSCAPLFSILAYSILGVVYFFLGVRSTALSVGLSVAVVSLAAYGLLLFVARRKGVALGSGERADRQFDAALVSAYLAVGVVVGLFAFVLPLDGPASSVQTYDNVHHFASVRSFSDSGMWSSLHVSSYLDVSDPAANPLPGTGYYPSGWHIVCSMVVSALGVEVALAVNAVNFLFAAIVFPLSMAFLMKVLFSGDRAIALIGALGAVAVGAFPWVLVEVWPLYPNTAAFALVPVLVACFAAVWGRDASRRERVAYGAVFVLGCCCMAFMQPNAVFSAAEAVKNFKATVPVHLQDSHYKGAAKLGHGLDYKYAHNYPNHYVKQQYLPDELVGRKFYVPSENGYEKNIREYFDKIKN